MDELKSIIMKILWVYKKQLGNLVALQFHVDARQSAVQIYVAVLKTSLTNLNAHQNAIKATTNLKECKNLTSQNPFINLPKVWMLNLQILVLLTAGLLW